MKKQLIFLLIAFSTCSIVFAQSVQEPKHSNPDWAKPYEPFRIAGNLYYVGTYDLASYLITTSKGNILINTGLASSAAQIRANIEQLGFDFKHTKILLTTQAHYDHMGAMATIKKQTGAQFFVDKGDAEVTASGGKTDYELGKYGVTFKPVEADRILNNGDTVTLGEAQLILLHHPGHTKGSCSYMLTVKDSSRSYRVLIANIPTIINDRKFEEIKDYPGISNDFASSIASMKKLDFDIWVASHASQFGLHEKHKPGAPYNPSAFMDRKGYDEVMEDMQKAYEEKLKEDTGK
ncbi:MAG: subclass B3 metallo-beta-lactamase [Ferruginibacter sp.]